MKCFSRKMLKHSNDNCYRCRRRQCLYTDSTQLSTFNYGEGKCKVKMQVCVEVLNLNLSMSVTISFSFLENVLTRSHSTMGKRKD